MRLLVADASKLEAGIKAMLPEVCVVAMTDDPGVI